MNSYIIFIILLILFINTKATYQVYGFRWFLGQKFAFTMPQQQKIGSKYIFAFNSHQQIDIPLTLIVGKDYYTCSSRHIKIQTSKTGNQTQYGQTFQLGPFETYIHFCNVYTQFKNPQNYSVMARQTRYEQKDNMTQLTGRQTIFFYNGTFRPISEKNNTKFLSLGDWGKITSQVQKTKGYIPTLPCILQRVKEDNQIVGVLFLGDLGYDMQGQIYTQMLKYIQPLTSQMVWIGVPGNHDTAYHDDSFMLITQSFRVPLWNNYHNYLFTAQIGLDVLLVGYNPQNQVEGFTRMIQDVNLPNNFKIQFSQEKLNYISKNKTVIVMSHYPLFASKNQILQKRKNIIKYYRSYFDSMGLDLYISGHLHLYQRLKPICLSNFTQQGNFSKFGDQYLGQCPVFIIDGAAGNSYYVQTQNEYQLLQYSAKIVLNTGFGILTINKSEKRNTKEFKYEHFSAKNCSVADQISIPVNIQGSQQTTLFIKFLSVAIIVIGAIVITIIIIWLILKAKRMPKSNKHNNDQDIVMVEQQFQSNSQKQRKDQNIN